MTPTLKKVLIGVLAAAAIVPTGLGINAVRVRNAEIGEYKKVCDAKAVDVNVALRDSIKAQKRFIALAKRLLGADNVFEVLPLVGAFVDAREQREIAAADSDSAYFDGVKDENDSFYRACDRIRYNDLEDGEPNYDSPKEYLVDISPATEKALELWWEEDDLRQEADRLQELLNSRYGN